MLSDLLNETLTVTRNNDRGTRPASSTIEASVQPMGASRLSLAGLQAGQTGFTCYADTDPGVHAGDALTRASGAVLQVQGPARDEAGRGVCYAVDCVAID